MGDIVQRLREDGGVMTFYRDGAEVFRLTRDGYSGRPEGANQTDGTSTVYAVIEQLQAENARLRAALEVYADPCDKTEGSPCGYEGNMCCRTARTALNTDTMTSG